MILMASDVIAALPDELRRCVYVMDADYWCPSTRWVIKALASHIVVKLRNRYGFRGYINQVWDCDDRALMLMVEARAMHSAAWRARHNDKPCGVAVGVMSYRRDNGNWHLANYVIEDCGGIATWQTFDWTERNYTHLTDRELSTIRMGLL